MVRRQPKQPPPPDGVERRKQYRREDDEEVHVIAEGAVEAVSYVKLARKQFLNLVLGTVIGCAVAIPTTTIGMSIRGPKQEIEALGRRIDTNSTSLVRLRRDRDSLITEVRDLKLEVRDLKTEIITMTNVSCFLVRRLYPDVAQAVSGCANRNIR